MNSISCLETATLSNQFNLMWLTENGNFFGHAVYGKMEIANDDPDMKGGDYLVNIFGGYLGIRPTKWLRLTAGAGPILIWASRETEPEESESEEIGSKL